MKNQTITFFTILSSTLLYLLTINGAWQLGLEKQRGSIKTGKCADFILVNQDVLSCLPMNISHTKVAATFIDGNLVYERIGN